MSAFYNNSCALVDSSSSNVISLSDAIAGCEQYQAEASTSGCSASFSAALSCMGSVRNAPNASDSTIQANCTSCDPQLNAYFECLAGEGDGDNGSSPAGLDWYSSPCSELGGVLTATGACYVSCRSDADCPTSQVHCGVNSVWTYFACVPTEESRLTRGCGTGFFDNGFDCSLACGGSDADCPTGWRCVDNYLGSADYFCTGYTGGSSGGGGTGCPDWCGFPYCDGACLGCC
jgi:hypothetical protein